MNNSELQVRIISYLIRFFVLIIEGMADLNQIIAKLKEKNLHYAEIWSS